MQTPRTISPYFLIQEALRDEPWKLLVACMFLNQTSAKQVHRIINEFFERWPRASSVVFAFEKDLAEFLKPLGLQNRRAKTLIKMSQAWVEGDWKEPEDLPGVGKYAGDSYRIFCRGYLVEDVQDKELRNYVQWAREVARGKPDADGGDGSDLWQGERASEGPSGRNEGS